jgi:hypothetical protein
MAISNRICLQCGTPFAGNEGSCRNCGALYPAPHAQDTMQDPLPAQLAFDGSPAEYQAPGDQPPSALPGQAAETDLPADPGPDQSLVAETRLSVARIGVIVAAFLLIGIVLAGGMYFILRGKMSSGGPANPALSSSPSVQPLFTDTFADNTRGWSTGNGAGYSSAIGNNTLVLAEANHRIIYEPIPNTDSTPASFTDFMVTTTVTILKADQNDSAGLYLRGDGGQKQGYFIDIYGDSSYDIVKIFPDGRQDTYLVAPTPSSNINPQGQPNKLTVIMKGSKMVVLINNKLVNTIVDSGYAGGQIALFAENGSSSNGINATFGSVAVYPAPRQVPG